MNSFQQSSVNDRLWSALWETGLHSWITSEPYSVSLNLFYNSEILQKGVLNIKSVNSNAHDCTALFCSVENSCRKSDANCHWSCICAKDQVYNLKLIVRTMLLYLVFIARNNYIIEQIAIQSHIQVSLGMHKTCIPVTDCITQNFSYSFRFTACNFHLRICNSINLITFILAIYES